MGSELETATGDGNPLSDVYIIQTKTPDDVSRVAKEAKAIQGLIILTLVAPIVKF